MATPNVDLLERMKVIGQRIREGRDSYAGRLDAWHKLGIVTGTYQTWKELLAAAKADFSVVKFPLQFGGVDVDAFGTFRVDPEIPQGVKPTKQVELPDGRIMHLTFLGTVGKDYNVIQHTDGFEILDHLVGQIDGAHYETMGTLDFGRLVWGQIKPNIQIAVGGDVTEIYLTFHTSHDGSRSFEIFETGVREVCRNTFRMGSLKRLAATLRVRHTKNAQKRITDLKTEIDEIKNVAMSMQDRLTWLSTRKVQKESLTSIMNRLFPPTKNDDGVEQSSGRRDNILAGILARYESNDNNAFPEFRGSMYNLLNAVVEYCDHDRGSNEDNRAKAAVFGTGDTLKSKALDLILAEAEKAPAMLRNQPGVAVDYAELGLNIGSKN
jgi:phage/plasmid-like protein (TIGR03299 family)